VKKQSFQTVTNIVCGLALSVLTMSAALAQGGGDRQATTLWQPSDVVITNVAAGDQNDQAAVVDLFSRMSCATDTQGHYVIGQLDGNRLTPYMDVGPDKIKQDQAQNTISITGQMQAGPLKGAQVQGQFQQAGAGLLNTTMHVTQETPKKVDVTVGFKMRLVWQAPDTVKTPTGQWDPKNAKDPKDPKATTDPKLTKDPKGQPVQQGQQGQQGNPGNPGNPGKPGTKDSHCPHK
jgi:hypothetical protein